METKKTKRPYVAPKATVVALQVEERLMACGKVKNGQPQCHKQTLNLS